jgi:paraquat-inducible protein B
VSKKANPAAVGSFLVVGLVLGLAGVLLFSTGGLFHRRAKYILYFNGSLKGLDPGAPVKFRGVTVGKVEEVLVHHNQASNDFAMPVIISIDTKLAQLKSDEQLQFDRERLDYLIEHGFRGRLDSESLVTGILYIGLEFMPDPPSPTFHQLKPEYLEFPTIQSQVQKLLANLDRLDMGSLSDSLNKLLGRMDTSFSQLNMAEINTGITNLLGSANRLVTTPDVTNSIAALRTTLAQAGALLQRIDSRVDPLADSVSDTLHDASKTMAGLRMAVGNASDLLSPDSAFRPNVVQALEQLANASRSVAELADFLKRNPNTLLTGRKPLKEQP